MQRAEEELLEVSGDDDESECSDGLLKSSWVRISMRNVFLFLYSDGGIKGKLDGEDDEDNGRSENAATSKKPSSAKPKHSEDEEDDGDDDED